jgi:ubiquinone/menaquinone biosynthesis C-methylase UbiE
MKDAGTAQRTQEGTVVRHYATLAPKYDRRWDRYTRVSLGTLLNRLKLRGDEHVLDTACGTNVVDDSLR